MRLATFLVLPALLAFLAPAAADYRPRYSQRTTIVVPTQQFFYFVGQPLRIAALWEAEKRADPDYQRFLQFQSLRGQAEPAPSPAASASGAAAILIRRCAACHGGAAPQGGLRLDGKTPLTAAQVTNAQRRVLRREMPPAEPLSEVEIGQALPALLSLERTER